jgi:hypothetical protein
VATVDDALEWFVSAMIGHVLLQPGLGGRALAEDLAAFPVTLELSCSFITAPLPVTHGMNSLKKKIFLLKIISSYAVVSQLFCFVDYLKYFSDPRSTKYRFV